MPAACMDNMPWHGMHCTQRTPRRVRTRALTSAQHRRDGRLDGRLDGRPQLRKDQRTYLCTIAKGENPITGVETRMSLMCKD